MSAFKDEHISDKGIQDIKGIEYFSALETLYCDNNQLTELDVSKNLSISTLGCENNNLSELNVSNCGGENKEIDLYVDPSVVVTYGETTVK